MRLRNALLLLIGAVALFVMVGWTRHEQNIIQSKPRWEYRSAMGLSDEQLNELGSAGWELVGFSVDESRNKYFYFKRPR
jgi:hypothetical protein